MSLVLDPAPARAIPAPEPQTEVPGTLALPKGLRDNPVATWTRWHFEQPIVYLRSGHRFAAMMSDPIREAVLSDL